MLSGVVFLSWNGSVCIYMYIDLHRAKREKDVDWNEREYVDEGLNIAVLCVQKRFHPRE